MYAHVQHTHCITQYSVLYTHLKRTQQCTPIYSIQSTVYTHLGHVQYSIHPCTAYTVKCTPMYSIHSSVYTLWLVIWKDFYYISFPSCGVCLGRKKSDGFVKLVFPTNNLNQTYIIKYPNPEIEENIYGMWGQGQLAVKGSSNRMLSRF